MSMTSMSCTLGREGNLSIPELVNNNGDWGPTQGMVG